MKKENQVNQSRRDLLKGLGSAAVAGADVAGVSTQTVASESSTDC
ncbi:twin-arginine translocation signal domain-containing protein, partial [Vibrio cholerae]